MTAGPARRPESDDGRLRLRLYVAGDTPHSSAALANLRALCERELAGCYEIDVVDVLEEPDRPFADGIYLTPTVVRLAPLPRSHLVGTLQESEAMRRLLRLPVS